MNLTLGAAIGDQSEIGMCVHVDEARTYRHARDIDDFGGVLDGYRAHSSDLSALDRDISYARRCTRAVMHVPAFQNQVEHAGPLIRGGPIDPVRQEQNQVRKHRQNDHAQDVGPDE